MEEMRDSEEADFAEARDSLDTLTLKADCEMYDAKDTDDWDRNDARDTDESERTEAKEAPETLAL